MVGFRSAPGAVVQGAVVVTTHVQIDSVELADDEVPEPVVLHVGV